jgi:activator of HSP90 ATPase
MSLEDQRAPGALSRRQALAGLALAAGSLAGVARAAPADAPGPDTRTALRREADLKASAKQVYDLLLDSKAFAAMTGRRTVIDPVEGGAFSMFDGVILGRNIELVPNRRIVQAWRPTHWEAGTFSIVRFDLAERGAVTHLTLEHRGFPEGDADSLDTGWTGHYLAPMAKLFG